MLSILIASNIPVVFQLLIIIDDPDACDSTMRMWFIVVKRNYMLIFFTLRPCFNQFSTCFVNHLSNLFFINTLQWLLTVKENGWNKWVILAGTLYKYMVWARSISKTSAAILLRNRSMTIDAALLGNCNDLRCSFTNGTTISSMTLIDAVVLLKWLGLTLNQNESENLNHGKFCMVLPAYISCIGRKSPLSVMMNVAVILPLSADSSIGTDLNPFSTDMCLPDGTYFDGVWSKFIMRFG